MPKTKRTRRGKRKQSKKRYTRQKGAGLSNILPITTWGSWSALPGALAWSPTMAAPPPLANGGLYTNPQSTGPWASTPFPATQYALAAESARVSQLPNIFYQQRPADSVGNTWTPYVGQSISNQHWSAREPSISSL